MNPKIFFTVFVTVFLAELGEIVDMYIINVYT